MCFDKVPRQSASTQFSWHMKSRAKSFHWILAPNLTHILRWHRHEVCVQRPEWTPKTMQSHMHRTEEVLCSYKIHYIKQTHEKVCGKKGWKCLRRTAAFRNVFWPVGRLRAACHDCNTFMLRMLLPTASLKHQKMNLEGHHRISSFDWLSWSFGGGYQLNHIKIIKFGFPELRKILPKYRLGAADFQPDEVIPAEKSSFSKTESWVSRAW